MTRDVLYKLFEGVPYIRDSSLFHNMTEPMHEMIADFWIIPINSKMRLPALTGILDGEITGIAVEDVSNNTGPQLDDIKEKNSSYDRAAASTEEYNASCNTQISKRKKRKDQALADIEKKKQAEKLYAIKS